MKEDAARKRVRDRERERKMMNARGHRFCVVLRDGEKEKKKVMRDDRKASKSGWITAGDFESDEKLESA